MSSLLETDEHVYRTCVLYETLHSRDSSSYFCHRDIYDRMKKLMPNLEYDTFFELYIEYSRNLYTYRKESLDPDVRFSPDTKSDENDDRAFRICILYEVLNKKSVKDAYNYLRRVKKNVIFFDFQYWYYRFLHGNLDVDHDRSLDPKCRLFSDMPIDIVERIVKNQSLAEKIVTRKVCRRLRTVIDHLKTDFTYINLKLKCHFCEIDFNGKTVGYYRSSPENDKLNSAMNDLALVLTHPNWKFKNLDIDFHCEDYNPSDFPLPQAWHNGNHARKAALLLNSVLTKHLVPIQTLKVKTVTLFPLATLLPHLQAGVLESLDLKFSSDCEYTRDVITEMDQWKSLKELKMCHIPDEFPIETLFHIKEFRSYECQITEDRLVKMRDILFKSPIFEYCLMCFESKAPREPVPWESDEEDWDMDDLLSSVDRVMGAHTAYNPDGRKYKINVSNEHFRIEITREDDALIFEIRKLRD
ncbi:hypothetical protein CAEBREN_09788 [Caenorhabditis brenneri]|uniref:F-box domain-containing protein n=1 Tax=Caenorhabditis brenneri TaxID=135651 RepID=G0P0R8_CAEBE|nr:hypothetical protein CAEBREN_09788 [Caenorhabditis brenneri]